MKSGELFRDSGVVSVPTDIEIRGISCDSRRVKDGYLFICHRGSRTDGHDFAAEAQKNGAVLILGEHPTDGIENMLLTDSTRHAESVLWYNFTDRPTDGMEKIAVTGTAGKTSVSYLLRHILSAAGKKVGMISTVGVFSGNRRLKIGENGGSSVSDISGAMTTPDPEYFFRAASEMRDDGCETIVFEASSQAIAMGRLSAIKPNSVIYTNLSQEHLDYHLTMENYFTAKASLMNYADSAIINADDPWIGRLYEMFDGKKIIRCSANSANISKSEVCALKYTPRGTDGIEYIYYSRDAVFGIKTPLLGRYSVYNTMEAAACAINLGCDPITVKAALSDFRGVDGRLCKVQLPLLKHEAEAGQLPSIFIDYAHTPASLSAVLNTARGISGGRLIVLFGCGGDRDRTKRPEMAKAALSGADFTVITSDNPRTENPEDIIEDILTGVNGDASYTVIPDRREAIKYAVNISEAGDMLILAGKGHEKYEIDADGKHPFDEEELVCDAMYQKFGINRKNT